jgi:predicted nucleic acid-binding protein
MPTQSAGAATPTPAVVVYDANVLYPAPLRDLLIRLALSGHVRAKWTKDILDETFEQITESRPDLPPDRLQRTRELMESAIRDVEVTGYESLIESLDLPDPDDRHVLAAAIEAGAAYIITHDKKHFPAGKLAEYEIEKRTADEFVCELIDTYGAEAICDVVRSQAKALTNDLKTVQEVLDTLTVGDDGLGQAVKRLRPIADQADM